MSSTQPNILVVDMDSALLCNNMKHEMLWAALSKDPRLLWNLIPSLLRGSPASHQNIENLTHINPEALAYNDAVLGFARDWKKRQGKTVLITANRLEEAQAIADFLEIFDEVHVVHDKESFLEDQFGLSNIAYAGNAPTDAPFLEKVAQSITTNASSRHQNKTRNAKQNVTDLSSQEIMFGQYAKALRPYQWLKNLLVFVPVMSAHAFNSQTLGHALLAFISFSLIASSVYIVNDLVDLAADRDHPRKKLRPFASGRIPLSHGTIMAPILLIIGALLALGLGQMFFATLMIYYLLTLAYSLKIKRVIVIDICVLACLYSIRIVAGGVATDITLSVWLLAFSMFFFLSLAAVKRKTELVDSLARGNVAPTGRGYHVNDLPIISMISISAGYISILVLALYLNSEAVMALYPKPEFLWGVCVVLLYWITRTVMLAHRGDMHDDPLVYAVKDHISLACLGFASAFVAVGMFP